MSEAGSFYPNKQDTVPTFKMFRQRTMYTQLETSHFFQTSSPILIVTFNEDLVSYSDSNLVLTQTLMITLSAYLQGKRFKTKEI